MKQEGRLQSARYWLKTYAGRDLVRGYRRHYGVDTVCAILELRRLGIAVSDERLRQARCTEEQRARQRATRRARRQALDAPELFHCDGTFAYIAGYTPNGVPFGVTWEELERLEQPHVLRVVGPDEIPF